MTLIGRDDETAELRELVADGGALIVGPPGIGKTALAMALEPSVVVHAEGLATPEALQTALVRALGAEADNPVAVRTALEAHALVLIDGLEVDPSPWVGACPLLLTARRRLVVDLDVLDLGPLSPELGAELLRARVRGSRRARTLEDAALKALSEALDGVPLALELAATSLRLHPPQALAARAMETMVGANRLLGAIHDSLGSLEPRVRAVLEVAAVLPGSFDAQGLAEAAGESVDEALITLLDHALIHALDGMPPRFRLLAPIRHAVAPSESMRQAVIGRLAAHLPRAEARAEALIGEGSPKAMTASLPLLELLLDSEDEEVQVRAGVALAAVELRIGPLEATLERDVDLAGKGTPEQEVRWALAVSAAACQLVRPEIAEKALIRVAQRVPDSLRADWLEARAELEQVRGNLDMALALAKEAVARGDEAWLNIRAGSIQYLLGEFEACRDCFVIARRETTGFRFAQATYGLCLAMYGMGASARDILAEVTRAEAAVDLDTFPWLAVRMRSIRAVLQIGLGEEEALDALAPGAAMCMALGEPGEAANQWVLMQWARVALGLPIEDGEPLAEAARPERVDMVYATRLAMQGDFEGAVGIGVPAAKIGRKVGWHDVGDPPAYLAVALHPGDPETAEALLADSPMAEEARQAIAGTLDPEQRMELHVLASLGAAKVRHLTVQRDGKAFRMPSGEVVDIARRRVLRKVLAALAETEDALDVGAICERVWPGEALVGDSGTRRVHVAISSLRKLGLRDAIVTQTEDGHTTWALVSAREDAV